MEPFRVASTLKYPAELPSSDRTKSLIGIKEFDPSNATEPKTWVIGLYQSSAASSLRDCIATLLITLFPNTGLTGTRPMTEMDVRRIRKVVSLSQRTHD